MQAYVSGMKLNLNSPVHPHLCVYLKLLVARLEDIRNACRIIVGKPEVKRPLERPWRRWEDNIIIDPKESGSKWGQLACPDRLSAFQGRKTLAS
jgi:hypothetical protein